MLTNVHFATVGVVLLTVASILPDCSVQPVNASVVPLVPVNVAGSPTTILNVNESITVAPSSPYALAVTFNGSPPSGPS